MGHGLGIIKLSQIRMLRWRKAMSLESVVQQGNIDWTGFPLALHTPRTIYFWIEWLKHTIKRFQLLLVFPVCTLLICLAFWMPSLQSQTDTADGHLDVTYGSSVSSSDDEYFHTLSKVKNEPLTPKKISPSYLDASARNNISRDICSSSVSLEKFDFPWSLCTSYNNHNVSLCFTRWNGPLCWTLLPSSTRSLGSHCTCCKVLKGHIWSYLGQC